MKTLLTLITLTLFNCSPTEHHTERNENYKTYTQQYDYQETLSIELFSNTHNWWVTFIIWDFDTNELEYWTSLPNFKDDYSTNGNTVTFDLKASYEKIRNGSIRIKGIIFNQEIELN